VKPTTKAYAAAVTKGRKVKLAYLVSDAKPAAERRSSPSGSTRARSSEDAQGWHLHHQRQDEVLLALHPGRGKYTLKVYATDIAGNAQSKIGSAKLRVR